MNVQQSIIFWQLNIMQVHETMKLSSKLPTHVEQIYSENVWNAQFSFLWVKSCIKYSWTLVSNDNKEVSVTWVYKETEQ
jgi:hypothetical protein